ncbi:unnamed protein product [marine sediment metagenome]|uniref:DUF362 domain-containing protein n=1 Tax=marine sediment metagenome TaxID=412755 RepID=X1BD86_9ZZZZ
MSDVYFFTARTHNHKESMSKVKGPLALKNLGIEKRVKNNDKVVIKCHFGALGNTRYLRPSYIRFLCDYIKELGGAPFVAESCGWGIPGAKGEYGGRANEQEYLEVALKHGYTDETMGAHIIGKRSEPKTSPNKMIFNVRKVVVKNGSTGIVNPNQKKRNLKPILIPYEKKRFLS